MEVEERERERDNTERGAGKKGVKLTCRLTQSGAIRRRDADATDAAGGANTNAQRLIRCAHGQARGGDSTATPRCGGQGRLQLQEVTAGGHTARLLLLLRCSGHRVGVGGGGLRQRVPTAPRLFGTVDAYGGAAGPLAATATGTAGSRGGGNRGGR